MWVTFEGAHGLSPADSGDHFLDVGQQLTVQAGQRVVLEAMNAQRSAPAYFNWRKISIYGGSNEIQRNIIAKAVLGL